MKRKVLSVLLSVFAAIICIAAIRLHFTYKENQDGGHRGSDVRTETAKTEADDGTVDENIEEVSEEDMYLIWDQLYRKEFGAGNEECVGEFDFPEPEGDYDDSFRKKGVATKKRTIGGFQYEYKVLKEGTWITKITPKPGKELSILDVPSKLGGKSVVRIGNEGDDFYYYDPNNDDYYDPNSGEQTLNIFGEYSSEYDPTTILPRNIYELEGKIKEIKLPKTLKWISLSCFKFIQDGKELNIPQNVKTELRDTDLMLTKWKKVSISPKNKKYKIANGCLLSKDGKTLYGIMENKKEIVVPEGVETIPWQCDYRGVDTIKIPGSVTDISKRGIGFRNVRRTTDGFWQYPACPLNMQISEKNKVYAEKDGSIYEKVSGELIYGNNQDGILKIPDTVKLVHFPGFLSGIKALKKVIIPASVTEFRCHRYLEQGYSDITYIFEGETPPEVIDGSAFKYSKIYVPKGCGAVYKKAWKNMLFVYPNDYTIEEIEE